MLEARSAELLGQRLASLGLQHEQTTKRRGFITEQDPNAITKDRLKVSFAEQVEENDLHEEEMLFEEGDEEADYLDDEEHDPLDLSENEDDSNEEEEDGHHAEIE